MKVGAKITIIKHISSYWGYKFLHCAVLSLCFVSEVLINGLN